MSDEQKPRAHKTAENVKALAGDIARLAAEVRQMKTILGLVIGLNVQAGVFTSSELEDASGKKTRPESEPEGPKIWTPPGLKT